MFSYEYARPALTVDLVVIREGSRPSEILLIRRKEEPFPGMLALPGGFVNEGESPETAAIRELREETNIRLVTTPDQVGAYGKPGRDPRGWVVSIAYLCRVPEDTQASAGDDAAATFWVPVKDVFSQPLAFDHDEIIGHALVVAADNDWYD